MSVLVVIPSYYNKYTCSISKCKNEVGCRDDTVPKTVDTKRHGKVWLRACNNLPRPWEKTRCRDGVGGLSRDIDRSCVYVSTCVCAYS